jgi:hypothetical protein
MQHEARLLAGITPAERKSLTRTLRRWLVWFETGDGAADA